VPLKSEAQRRYLWVHDKAVARKMEHDTPKSKKKNLPYHKKKKKGDK
jgi:hypothetical protein